MTSDTSHSSIFLLPGLYNETLHLLAETHMYFYHNGLAIQASLTARQAILFTSEMSRITIRLSCIMAWLMARRAVFLGKLSEQDALEKHRLECHDVGMSQNVEAESFLPEDMCELLDKSFELFQRVARLDGLVAAKSSNAS